MAIPNDENAAMMKILKKMNARIVYIDWMRIVAAMMVVMIHTSGMLYMNNPEGSFSYLLGFWNQELVRPAVPLFFMISGALLLRPGNDANPRKMVRKAIKLLALKIPVVGKWLMSV